MPERASRSTAAAAPESQAAVTLIVGEEELLVERAIASVLGQARSRSDAAGAGAGEAPDVHDVQAGDLSAGELTMLTAPSLFGGECVVVVRSAQDANQAVAAEIGKLAADPPPDVRLVIGHAGGAKGKALLAILLKSGVTRIDCPSVRRFGERMDFLRSELATAGRKADDSGLRALIDAVGTDLRDLAAACDQLAADTTGIIAAPTVARYWRGRAEATGFSVADRTLEGNLSEALAQLRWALAIGTAPVLITSALARGLRTLGQVGTSRGKSADAIAAELGMPAWKVDRVRQQVRGWSAAGLARAHSAVAQADADVKGEGASAGYALERAVRIIVASRSAAR
jgi:DNA polymerase III subunit delta